MLPSCKILTSNVGPTPGPCRSVLSATSIILFKNKGQGYDSLVESLGKDVLPIEYGGKNGPLEEHIGTYVYLLYVVFSFLIQQLGRCSTLQC